MAHFSKIAILGAASFNSTRLQTSRCDYEFSDFPWPNRDNECFPTYEEILEYLHDYANHFDVMKFIRFESKVVELRFVGDEPGPGGGGGQREYGRLLTGRPAWEVAVKMNNSDEIQWYAFEFVGIRMGKYGDVPHVPSFPLNKGPDVFRGHVLHTLDYCKLDTSESEQLLQGKKVVIVGYKKSAIDLAFECAQFNRGNNYV